MRIQKTIVTLLCICLAAGSIATASAGDIEVTIDRLHPKAIKIGSGKTYGDTMLAIASEKGLVVVDTGTTVRATRAYRSKIEEVFGRDDFLYVVNTHYHYDHTVGNPVFPEATVISHDLTLELLIGWYEDLDRFITQQQARVDGWLTTLETADPADQETVRLQDLVEKYSWMCEDLRADYEPHLPTITFSDRLHLDLGDITMDLYYFGPGTHTGDDIMVHVPDLGIVATGDLLHHQFTQFLLQVEPDADIPYKVAVFDAILADPDLEHVVPVHSRVMNRAEFQIRRDYANDVWDGVISVIESGGTRADAREQLDLGTRFAYMADLGIDKNELERQHKETVTNTWMLAKDVEDARAAVRRIIDEKGIDDASSGRIDIWSAALRVMLEWPLSFVVGYGWNTFGTSGIWKAAHSEYINALYELGAIGLVFVLALFAVIIGRARAALRFMPFELARLQIAYIYAVVGVLVAVVFVEVPAVWSLFWIYAGLMMSVQAHCKDTAAGTVPADAVAGPPPSDESYPLRSASAYRR